MMLCASINREESPQTLPLPLAGEADIRLGGLRITVHTEVRNPTCSQTDGFVIFLVVFCESSRGGVAAMKRNLARRVVIFGSMLTAAVTVAQAAAANPLTVSEALKNNPELRGLAADVEATMLKLNNVILSSNSF
jgi:hypothetical protein